MGAFLDLLLALFSSSVEKANNKHVDKMTADTSVVKSDEWEVYFGTDDKPWLYQKNGKDWFNESQIWSSPSGEFFFGEGYDGNDNEYIALLSRTQGLKRKTIEDYVETAFVTDDGKAYALTEESILHVLTAESTAQRSLRYEDNDPEKRILTPTVAVAIYNDYEETIIVKGVDLSAIKSWTKKIKYQELTDDDDNDISIDADVEVIDGIVKITLPDGNVKSFTAAGEPIA